MKRGTGKLLVGLACGLLIAGGIGAIAYGSDGFTNSDLTTWFDGDWRSISIIDQTKEYTGSKVEPDIVLPEGFTYEIVKIETNGEEVALEEGAVASGNYIFTVKVTKTETGESRNYFANLTISAENELPTKIEAKNIVLKVAGVQALANGDIVKTITYSVQPTDADPTIKVDSILKGGEDASSIVDVEINTAAKEITLTCHEAFNQQILVKVVHADNSDINATITCDYRKKLLSKAFNVSLGDYGKISGTKISLDAYKIYNEFSGSGKFTLNPTSAIVQNFSYSIGTLEYEKSSVSANITESLGNNYSTSSSLTSLKMSNGSYIGLTFGNTLSFNVNQYFKNVVNGVKGLASGSYTIAQISYVDECGGNNYFTLELTASGSFLSSMSVSGNVIF